MSSVLKISPSMSNTTARTGRGSFASSGCIDLLPIRRSGRGLRGDVIGDQQMDQRALDYGLPGRRVDLGAEQVGDVEHVSGALAEGRDMGGRDVEVELRDRGGQLIQQPGAVEAGHLV